MRREIIIAGLGDTEPVLVDSRSIPEMVLVAVEAALADAGIGYGEIDAVVTASVDLFDGITASNIAVTEVVGAVMKPETRISADGLAAIAHGACQIWAGAYETVLVVGHAKTSMARYQDLTQWAMDPIHMQPLGVDFLTCAGLQASMLAKGDASAYRRWAQIAAERRGRAGTPLAPASSVEEILASEPVALPLRQGMCAPMGDGACAIVLRGAAASAQGPVLGGVGYDLEPHALGDRDLTHWHGLERALRRACKTAGLEREHTHFDFAEPSCLFAHEEELFIAAAGLRDDTEVSADGGLLAGCVPVVAGMSRLAAAARQLRGAEGGGRRALAHGTWGPAAQGQIVAILEGTPL